MRLLNEIEIEPEIEAGFAQYEPKPVGETFCLWLVEDNEGFRGLLAELLEKSPRLDCARQFSSAEALLEALAVETPPDLVLLDFNLGGMTGAEAIPLVKAIAPLSHAVIMTTFYDPSKKFDAREAGAEGFLIKTHDWDSNMESLIEIAERPATKRPRVESRARLGLQNRRNHLAGES